MKKFISMAMVAAMTTSMVPATAFAADSIDATAKVVNSKTFRDTDPLTLAGSNVPELQIKLTDVSSQGTAPTQSIEFTVELDGAEFDPYTADDLVNGISVRSAETGQAANTTPTSSEYTYSKMTEAQIKAEFGKYYDDNTYTLPTTIKEAAVATIDAGPSPFTSAQGTAANTDFAAVVADTTIAAMLTAGGTAEDNRQDTFEAYAVQTVAKGGLGYSGGEEGSYTYKDDWAAVGYDGQAGWYSYNAAAAANAFVPLADVITFAKDTDTSDGATVTPQVDAAGTAVLNTAQTAFVATTVDKDTWVNAAWTELTTSGGTSAVELNTATDAWYKETKTDLGLTDATGDHRTFTATVTPKDVDANGNYNEVLVQIDVDTRFAEGDVISMDLLSKLDKARDAYVSVKSDDVTISNAQEDMLYVAVEDEGIEASVAKLAKVAEEEMTFLEKDMEIEATVGSFANNQVIELNLSNGFEYGYVDTLTTFAVTDKGTTIGHFSLAKVDDDKVEVTVKNDVPGYTVDKFEIPKTALKVEAVSAKAGDIATIKVKATNNVTGAFNATAAVEVAEVIDYTVLMSVDEDEDVPVIYSGTNVANTGITDDSDHLSLEVTIEESFPGAWSMRQGFELELPDGVYVTDVKVKDVDGLTQTGTPVNGTTLVNEFKEAYQDGDHKNFEFGKRVFDDVDTTLNPDEAMMQFELELVADPTFVGDVTLKLTGDLVDEQEVTIAKFAPIAIVEAQQNDLKIDYRYTEIPTEVKVTETEAGLWKEGSEFYMAIEKGNYMEFEEDATFEVTGGLEIDDFEDERNFKSIGFDADDKVNAIGFEVEEESDDAATVTISNMSLFMQRNIPAGAYDLIAGNTASAAYLQQGLFAPDQAHALAVHNSSDCDDECFIKDVEDFSDVVKEAFINIVTAGREQDDASFTTKVVVPVGESYIVSGENTVELDVPAYVSAAGYTMLPVRAVANALGINNNNVIWNGETKTVTILYGQRIITMVAGQKVINVNGSAIPASAAVEIVDGRTFLPMRDLATALGVTDITWDAATKTATLNGGVVAE